MNQTTFFESLGMPQDQGVNPVTQDDPPEVEDKSWETHHPFLIPESEAFGGNDCYGEFSPKSQ
jgi:hypothetical protein